MGKRWLGRMNKIGKSILPDTLEQADPIPCRDLARNRTPYVLPNAKTEMEGNVICLVENN